MTPSTTNLFSLILLHFFSVTCHDPQNAVCSGSVVEDIDMAEMASVASDGGGKRGLPPQFTSNLNDMGPPLSAGPLCSALLLAANAACRPSSASLRSFDTNDDKSAVSDVVAHVDTVKDS